MIKTARDGRVGVVANDSEAFSGRWNVGKLKCGTAIAAKVRMNRGDGAVI